MSRVDFNTSRSDSEHSRGESERSGERKAVPALSAERIGQIVEALRDPSGTSIATVYSEIFQEYGPVVSMPNAWGGQDVLVGRFKELIAALSNDRNFVKPMMGPFEELVGGASLFGVPTFSGPDDEQGLLYKTYRTELQQAFSEKVAAARFQDMVEEAMGYVDMASSSPISLAEFSRRLSARFAEVTLGRGIEFPEGFAELTTNIVFQFFAARIAQVPEAIAVYEENLALMKGQIDELVENYKSKFEDGLVDKVSAEEDILGAIIWLSQNVPAALEGEIDQPILANQVDLQGQIFSGLSGGLETVGYVLGAANTVFYREPHILEKLKADIREAVAENGFSLKTIRDIPSMAAFIDQLINGYGPSFEMQRMAMADPGEDSVDLAGYKIPPYSQIKLHLAEAIEEHYGVGLNTPMSLEQRVGKREGFGDKKRRCIGQRDSEAYIMSYVAALTFSGKKPQFGEGFDGLDDRRGIVRFIDPTVEFECVDE